MHRQIFILFALFIALIGDARSQTRSYLAWLDTGEGTYQMFRLTADTLNGRLGDSLQVVHTNVHSVDAPREHSLGAWQAVFASLTPLKARIVEGLLVKRQVSFKTERLIVGDKDWLRLSFKGKIRRDGNIEGWILSDWCPESLGGEVFSDRQKIIFFRE